MKTSKYWKNVNSRNMIPRNVNSQKKNIKWQVNLFKSIVCTYVIVFPRENIILTFFGKFS